MNTKELVHYVSAGDRCRTTPAEPIAAPAYHKLLMPLRSSVARARQHLLSEQRPDGSWRGRQSSDASLASQLVMMLAYLGLEQSELAGQATRAILEQQLPSGGWSRTPDGPIDVSTSVQAYSALKLTGHDPSDARLSRARDAIRKSGGADAADATTRSFLALLGQMDYDCCPPMAPEPLAVRRGYRHRLAAPLSIAWSHRAARDVGLERGVRELFVRPPSQWPAGRRQRWAAAAWHGIERWGWLPLRRRALELAESEVVERVTQHNRCRAGFDELIWLTVALHTLGYDAGSRPMAACEARLHDMLAVDEEAQVAWPQLVAPSCCDTAVAVETLCVSGVPLDHIGSSDTVGWLPRPARRYGLANTTVELVSLLSVTTCVEDRAVADVLPPDIQVANPWMICQVRLTEQCQARRRLARRAAGLLVQRVLARQNHDGGWSPDDGGRRSGSAADVTGAVLAALALHGNVAGHPAVDRAIKYLRRVQRPDGSWDSATGVRLVHGTSLAVRGLVAAELGANDPVVAAGVNWLVVHQQPSGGWGETVEADVPEADYVSARPTASQTAWAVLALSAAGRSTDAAACRGVHFLLETQEDDGRWDEPQFTLRDTASGRWYRNDLYAVTSPLMALSRWAVAAVRQPREAGRVQLRLVGVETTA